MRVLVLGGTKFLSKAVATELVRRGHDVLCAARGASGDVPAGARLIRVDRNDPDGFAPLAGERFDSVIDVATMSLTWVNEALQALAANAGHWTFVSSISVYADHGPLGQDTSSEIVEPLLEVTEARTPADNPAAYGRIKVASENRVREELGDRAFIPRPGLITGHEDWSDRFGYWPARFYQGGRAVVPDVPEQPAQYVDVLDLANWLVDASEQRLGGTFDAIGPITPFPELIAEVAQVAGQDIELVPVAEDRLTAAEVKPWSGPRSLPVWAPGHHGMLSHDPKPAADAGLRHRSLGDATRAALENELRLGLERERRAGLTHEEEAELLRVS
ncbi:epimerase [Allokutzneria sp. A3M-2-11 16]|uniref:NAD-dependent epimerase/dehydratase family protein n=1 Tax=Allokutzneria sp. A3M-2-11 16 TaxID=2962043 RepID=UPI0020B6B941|nr:NAD-dependent epimerase/dehydratase family protein [Allokutzneria sp. A3M-2-11 16]MCP3799223.1 epimerase [Allokutzneria sp. A3M-2-11 16]